MMVYQCRPLRAYVAHTQVSNMRFETGDRHRGAFETEFGTQLGP